MMMLISTAIGFFLQTLAVPGMSPFQTRIEQGAYAKYPFKTADPQSLLAMRWKKIISMNLFHELMKHHGYNNTQSDRMFHATEQLMNAEQLVLAKWRGVIDINEFNEKAYAIGYEPETMINLEKILKYYPNPQDFIRFMVRETFNQSIVDKFGYDTDYPKEIDEFVKKAGLEPEWMKHFWRAHWVLPSVTQGYEMLHRGEIDRDTLSELLKTADIPKFWRDKLINISYSPYTRVDIRRMHRLGVLSRDGVKRSYLDIGYDDDKAEQLTDFTVRYNLEEPKAIAETKVRDAYFLGKLKTRDAENMLNDLGYDFESARFVIALWDADMDEQKLKNEIDTLTEMYLFGDLDETQLTDKVTALGLPTESAERIVYQITQAKKRMKQLPSRSDLTRWLNQKIIDQDEYRTLMTELGYGQRFIENFVKETEIGGDDQFRVPTKKEILEFYKEKIIDFDQWVSMMFSLGYSEQNVARYAVLYGILPQS